MSDRVLFYGEHVDVLAIYGELSEMVGEITYKYQPDGWSQERFLAAGGFTVVFLNYNKKFLIEKSVRSALDQDYQILEMFFMDDASSDDSGDRMEEIVRAYRGRHKVMVVRNDENQYITGQWNIVSKLATGNWLGMFCGDDIAHPDRVSIVAERIRKYPTLRGIATAAVDIDQKTGMPLPDSHYVANPYFAFGTDSWDALEANFRSNGSTSFWHKSLFEDLIPRVPLDDNFLHFKVYVLNHGVNGPIFFYDSSVTTIDYSLGVGVCGGDFKSDNHASPRQKWVVDIWRYKNFLAKMTITMKEALRYAMTKGIVESELMPFVCHWWWCRIRSGDTAKRVLMLVPLLHFLVFGRAQRQRKIQLLRAYAYFFTLEFFGVRAASFIRGLKRCVA